MLAAVAMLAQPPVLVPELANGAAVETAALRAATLAAAQRLAERATRWLVVGAGPAAISCGEHATGTFRGFGVDVAVDLGPAPIGPRADLPLPALIAGWLRGRVGADVRCTVELAAQRATPTECLVRGAALRREWDGRGERWALLVLGDGPATLTARAPGAFQEGAAGFDDALAAALAAPDPAALAALDPQECLRLGVSGRVGWQLAAGVVSGGGDVCDDGWTARPHHRSAPFGVGYHVVTWEREL